MLRSASSCTSDSGMPARAEVKDDISLTSPRTPLPKLLLFILFYVQLAEPIASTVIYPFVNQLVKATGITDGDEKRTGYFAGLIESAFYTTEAVCVLQWGRTSDRIGRKPILLGGLLGMTLSMVGFGLSRQFWSVVLARCAEGALCGNIGVIKGMIAELTDVSNMAQAFAFLPMVWTTGAIIGPLVGGSLARPADRWPHTLGRLAFFHQYPYFLPCIMAAFVSVSAFLIATFLLDETLPYDLRHHGTSGGSITVASQLEELKPASSQRPSAIEVNTRPAASAVTHVQPFIEVEPHVIPVAERLAFDSFHTSRVDTKHPTLRSLLVRPVLLTIVNYAFLAFIDQCFVVLQPLMYSSSTSVGGLGFNSFTIGMILGIWGVISGIINIFAFPKVLRRFGIRRLYMAAFASYLVCLAGFPIMSIFVKRSGTVDAKVWIILILQLVFYILACMGYGCIFLYINDGAPRSALGALNGLAQTTASTMRALAPSTASSLFAVSLERDVVQGNMVYMVLCIITAAGVCASYQLPPRLHSQSSYIVDT